MSAISFQTLLTLLAAILIPAGFGGAGYVFLRDQAQRAQRRSRLAVEGPSTGRGGGAAAAAAGDIAAQVVEQVKRVGDRMAIQDPARLSALRQRLMRAGFFSREAVTFYLGARAMALGLATIATLIALPLASKLNAYASIGLAVVFAVAALLGPDQVIKMRISNREREYREGFPDLLDLLVASVEAGLSLDAAVGRITEELIRRYPRLAEHLKLLTLELRAGRSRREVWQRLADRLGIDEAGSFATMLRQAEEMGTSLGDTLKVFAEEMRSKRMLRAEEKALALPAKLVVPLILFIFPCLLGVLMLPAAFNVYKVLGHG